MRVVAHTSPGRGEGLEERVWLGVGVSGSHLRCRRRRRAAAAAAAVELPPPPPRAAGGNKIMIRAERGNAVLAGGNAVLAERKKSAQEEHI